jgi:hypothetical protein
MNAKPQLLILALLAAASLAIAGCGTDQNANGSGSYQRLLSETQPVQIVDRAYGSDQNLEYPQWKLIKTQQDLKDLGLSLGSDVNFEQQDMIIQALGKQPTGGYWAHINGVQRLQDTLYVQSTVNRPGEDQAVTQQVTYPYAAVIVPETGAQRLRTSTEEVTGQSRPSGGK